LKGAHSIYKYIYVGMYSKAITMAYLSNIATEPAAWDTWQVQYTENGHIEPKI